MKDYKEVVAHIFQTYEKKFGLKYPFKSVDGKIVKWLLNLYGDDQIMALWDSFLAIPSESLSYHTKEGKYIKRGHNLLVFQSKLSDLIELGAWKMYLVNNFHYKLNLKRITDEKKAKNQQSSQQVVEDIQSIHPNQLRKPGWTS